MIFTKSFFKKCYLCKINIFIPFQKINSVKKIHSVKKVRSVKQSHCVLHEFYFQFSFATNEQV